MKRIGLLGGTFDPFHNQHLTIAIRAYQKLKLDEVWIMPTKQNPLKAKVSASNEQRLTMIKLATKNYPWIKINDYELKSTQPSYTINTVTYLCYHYPQYKFFFIIGADNLSTLSQWQGINDIIKKVKIVVVNRPHYHKTLQLIQQYQCRNLVVYPSCDISAAKIRNGEVIKHLDNNVINYINENGLYIIERLRFNLDPIGVQHSLNVAQMAIKLAQIHDVNPQKAKIAALYHDLCKQWSKTKMIKYLSQYDKTILLKPWPVWHGYVAALYIKHHYQINDEAIINAVAKHTTGGITMNNLELVVLLADKIAAERTQPGVVLLRDLAFKNLTKAFILYLQILKQHLTNTNQIIDQQFLIIYDQWNK